MAMERAGEVGGGTAGRTALSATARWRALAATVASALGQTIGTALGVGAITGAGQLGIAYGLGLLHYPVPTTAGGTALTSSVWASQLTWVAWFAALAVLGGAASASWVARRQSRGLAPGGRAVVAVAAGIGATVVMPLAALPARSAVLIGPTESTEPALEAMLAAGLGLVVGILAAFATLSVRLVALSLTLLVAAVSLLALVSVAPSLGPTADLPSVRLGVLDLPALGGARSTVAVISPPLLALLVCGAIAWAARSRGLPPLLTAVSSAAAPGLLALAYLIGSPGTGERAGQVSAYAGSLIALATGLMVALLVGAVRLPSTSEDTDADTELAPVSGAGSAGEEPTGFTPPVSPAPVSPASPTSPAPASPAPVSPAPASPAPVSPAAASPAPTSPAAGPSPAPPPMWPGQATLPFPPDRPEPTRSPEPLFPSTFSLAPEPAAPSKPAEPVGPSEPAEPPPATPSGSSAPWYEPAPWDRPASWTDPAPWDEPDPWDEPAAAAAALPDPEDTALPEPAPKKRRRLPKLGRKSKPTPDPVFIEPPPAAFVEPPLPEPVFAEPPPEPLSAEAPPEPFAEPVLPTTSELPALPSPESSKRRRLPKLGRKPKPTSDPVAAEPAPEPAASEPAEPVSPARPVSPAAPEPPPAAEPPRPKRRGEVEHVDWISSLSDRSEEEPQPEKGRRRLRRDNDLGAPGDVPEPPTWPANDSSYSS